MGKSCVRFKKLEDLPLNLIGQMFARTPVKNYIDHIERLLSDKRGKGGQARKPL
jgi:hypothetical protein